MLLNLLKQILASPAAREIGKLILAAILGGFASAEIRQPTFTASWWPSFFKPAVEPADPVNAIGKISFGRSGCTATIIGPLPKKSSTVTILTAAHCVEVGQVGTMRLKDGREFSVKCVARDEQSDSAWLTAKRPEGKIPYARLATTIPEIGSKVWHQGYGIDRPNNREEGTLLGSAQKGAQLRFRLSASPGDSGGGIIANETGEVLSPVCCTTNLRGVGDVFGAHPLRSAAIKPPTTLDWIVFEVETDEPLIHPVLPLPAEGWPLAPAN